MFEMVYFFILKKILNCMAPKLISVDNNNSWIALEMFFMRNHLADAKRNQDE